MLGVRTRFNVACLARRVDYSCLDMPVWRLHNVVGEHLRLIH